MGKDYFKDDSCSVCYKTNGLENSTLKDKHLFGKHNVLRDEIKQCIRNILNPEVSNTVLMDTNAEKKDRNISIDDVDRLLESDDDDDETSDIQQMLLDNVFDDKEEENVINNWMNREQNEEEAEMDIQSRLLLDQDLSDDDNEEDLDGNEHIVNKNIDFQYTKKNTIEFQQDDADIYDAE